MDAVVTIDRTLPDVAPLGIRVNYEGAEIERGRISILVGETEGAFRFRQTNQEVRATFVVKGVYEAHVLIEGKRIKSASVEVK